MDDGPEPAPVFFLFPAVFSVQFWHYPMVPKPILFPLILEVSSPYNKDTREQKNEKQLIKRRSICLDLAKRKKRSRHF